MIFINFVCQECGRPQIRRKKSGDKYRFCSNKCAMPSATKIANKRSKSLENNPSWRGGIRHALGYKYILLHNHPFANKEGYVAEHRYIMEKKIGRYLLPTEKVHHLNRVKDDNRIENLFLYESQTEHLKRHHRENPTFYSYWKGKKRSIKTKKRMSISAKKAWTTRKSQ